MPTFTPYDPTGWSDTDPATWPPPIPPATLYQPGMVWTITAPGVVDGQPVAPGDRLYAIHRPRRYGDGTYGSGKYGSTPAGDWTTDDVAFLAWYADLPPDHQPPPPYSGCPFGDTGWWIIIESWFTARGRRYGDGTYGSGVYGGGEPESTGWHDITPGFVDVEITRGNEDGNPDTDAVTISGAWYDPDWSKWNLAPPASYVHPFVGNLVRVSFYDPVWRWYPRASGRIEQIVDPSAEPPRIVTVEAFGTIMDLAVTLLQWQRPAELASTRFAALLAAAGWQHGTVGLVYPGDVALHADLKPRDVTARDELDRTAVSAGWMFDTDRYGAARLRAWPLELGPVEVGVIDCDDHGHAGVVATAILHNADMSQLLNAVQVTNATEPPDVAQVADPSSIATYGGRDRALGFPRTGLAYADHATGQALVERVLDRYSRIVTHVDPVAADTWVDGGWLPVLAAVDTGQRWQTTRVHPDPAWTLDAIVVGVDETITPDRYVATISTTTTTRTT